MGNPLTVLGDLRFAIRSLARSPGFALLSIVTLGLGIGANTSAFSILNEVFLRPLPYPDSGQLDRIYRATPQNSRGGVSPADYLDFKAQSAGYGDVAAYAFTDMNVSAPGEPPEMVRGLRVAANLFPALGVQPALGRGFTEEEALEGHHRVLLLSHRYWKDRFGSDPGIVGRTVRVDGETHEIVGVLPPTLDDWRHLGPFDLFRPLALSAQERAERGSNWVRVLGRHSRDRSRAQAEAFVGEFGRRLAADFPAVHAGTRWRLVPLDGSVAPDNARVIFAMLIGLSLLVLLIACSNLANLLLARTMARAREFAVRAALGASRSRLLRPLFLESLLLALAGGVGALQVAMWTNDWMRNYGANAFGQSDFVFGLDWRTLGWAFGACLVTAVVFGVAPALFALRLDVNRTLKSGGRGSTGDRSHQRFRHALIVGQFALALVLLAGAGLFVRGIRDANTRDYGWRSSPLVIGTVSLPPASYRGPQAIADFQRLALARLEALPGVASASVSYSMPFFGLAEVRKYLVAGREVPKPGLEPVAATNGVSPHYFGTTGTRLLDGRAFDARDTLASPKVFVINESMARGLFAGENPLGRRIARAGTDTLQWGEVVGVVGDVQSVYPDRVPVSYQVYVPVAQEPRPAAAIAVRASGSAPAALLDGVRAAMAALDPDLPVRELQTADASIAKARNEWQVVGSMMSFLATLGLGLAALGMYGVIARTMAQRTSEFGIRIALGAMAGDITRLVLTSGAKLALAGSSLGLLGAFGLSRLIGSAFPNLHTSSPAVLAAVTAFLMAIALTACYLPARSASRISPVETLRAE